MFIKESFWFDSKWILINTRVVGCIESIYQYSCISWNMEKVSYIL